MTNWHGNGGGWGGDAPVFAWDWPETSEGGPDMSYGLPTIWITEQVWDPSDEKTGRDCIWHYTPEDDPDGTLALDYGACYYHEGMSCNTEDEHEKRIMCFRAAELLYLHASKKGNPIADLNLGYVYSYNRCEDKYWDRRLAEEATAESVLQFMVEPNPFDREKGAYLHYRKAAEADIAEACYKLGDLLRDGRGCEADVEEAFAWFNRAYELSTNDDPVIWGSAALRLGHAFEEGEGCDQSFEKARVWYERATTGLSIAVRGGEQWYRGALRGAEAGLARVRQELDGGY